MYIDNMSKLKLRYSAPKTQLLKWIGNKQKHAEAITKFFPRTFNRFFEPFLGSAAITATVAPSIGIGSDSYKPLMEIWDMFRKNPEKVIQWYEERRRLIRGRNKQAIYNNILASYNAKPNGADFLFLVRTCYGGVIRFRQEDGFMSTPCGNHRPISVPEFKIRAQEWYPRIKNCEFTHMEYQDAFRRARAGDLIYCDPPYSHSQSILYGAHSFDLEHLFELIERAKARGVHVALSIDGKKKSGDYLCTLPIPNDLFEKQVYINNGSSMLRRFQLQGLTTEGEEVKDRLLLTYAP
jgi:DNA adenine methylase